MYFNWLGLVVHVKLLLWNPLTISIFAVNHIDANFFANLFIKFNYERIKNLSAHWQDLFENLSLFSYQHLEQCVNVLSFYYFTLLEGWKSKIHRTWLHKIHSDLYIDKKATYCRIIKSSGEHAYWLFSVNSLYLMQKF